MLALGVGVAAVSLLAVAQMTSQVSHADGARELAVRVPASALVPGEQVAVSSGVGWQVTTPEVVEVWWTELEVFNAGSPPPAGATAVEMPWAGQSAQARWPHAQAGWRVVTSSQAGGWVLWRHG